jgi:hypothetical protein
LRGVEWAQQVAEARIQRQFEIADGLDAKGGILFAYCGALVVGAASLFHSGGETAMWVAITVALVGGVATALVLWPRDYQDPPDAKKLEAAVRGNEAKPVEVLEALLEQQLDAVVWNKTVLTTKTNALKLAIIAAGVSTLAIGVEIGLGRG